MLLKHKTWIIFLKSYLLLTVGSLLMVINFRIFLTPHQIAPGGLTGMTLLITRWTGLSDSAVLFGLQSIMMFVGFWYLGGFRFLTRTLYVSILYSAGVGLLQPWLPAQGITDDLLLNTVYGGLVGGIAIGLIFLGHGNVAGTSVISRLVQLKTGIPISQLYILVDGGIIFSQAVVFGWDKALYGLMMLFIWGLATDYVQEGPSVIRNVFIITDKPTIVSTTLFEQLGVGVTAWSGTGMFTYNQRAVLFCTVSRADISTLRQALTTADPAAFVVIGQGHQAFGGVVRPQDKPVAKPAASTITSQPTKPQRSASTV